ncbi:MAG: fatty acyl-CoA reductase [Oleiphilaceae bacterium]|nr:fatty acyl-CoA reductase [Oleiphilaceae bacterium]
MDNPNSPSSSGPRGSDPDSRVCQHLRGRRVLLTGTTGFLGKVVLEKLMRSVPDIGAVHLLIRSNDRFASARERFENDIITSSVFETLKLEDPEGVQRFCDERIVCHTGEMTEPFFAMTRSGFEALAEQVDAVINSAASVNFREPLDTALSINTLCLSHLMELVQAAGDIPLIQVSTCYVNGHNQGHIHEEVLRPHSGRLERHEEGYYPVMSLIRVLLDKVSDLRTRYTGEKLQEKLVELGIREARACGWNDTYTFTKWLGEQHLLETLRGGSVTIVRPSIIESTLREPVPGWVEGIKVADAVIMAYARQKVLFFPGRGQGVMDVIPADLVANSVLLSLAEQFMSPGRQRIYQCCSGSSNPITVQGFVDLVMEEAQRNYSAYDELFKKRPTVPFLLVNRTLFDRISRNSRLPVRLLNWGLNQVGLGSDDEALEKLETTLKLARLFGFYSCPRYIFHNDRLLDLATRMGSRDRTLFPVDSRAIDWPRYVHRHMVGLNRFALKERKLYSLSARKGKRRVA